MQTQAITIRKKRHPAPQPTVVTPDMTNEQNTQTNSFRAPDSQQSSRKPAYRCVRHYLCAWRIPSAVCISGHSLDTETVLEALCRQRVLEQKQLISTKELAQLLCLKPQTIAKWRSSGISDTPPALQLGKQIRYDLDEVTQWAYRHRILPSPKLPTTINTRYTA